MKAGVRIALDIGKVRTGIARSDLSGTIAFPHSVVLSEHLAAEIRNLITEFEPIVFYVGLPIDLRGRSGVAATDIRAQAHEVFRDIEIPMQFVDERMTTKIAESRLRMLETNTGDIKSKIDAMAAVVLLESALENEKKVV